jgi:hypothetical protein
MRQTYPFTAIVGQERMKRALILNAINPQIGGVLIRGERGTAKSDGRPRPGSFLLAGDGDRPGLPLRLRPESDPTSTATSAATASRPAMARCRSPTWAPPFVDLPVSATEDRVVGTLDIEKAIQRGERHFEPGVLACGQPRRALCRRSQPAGRPRGRPAAGLAPRWASMWWSVRASASSHPARVHPRRHDEPGRRRPAAAVARPLRPGRGRDRHHTRRSSASKIAASRRIFFEQDPDNFRVAWEEKEADELCDRIVQARHRCRWSSIPTATCTPSPRLTAGDEGGRPPRRHRDPQGGPRPGCLRWPPGRSATSDILLAAELALPHRMKKQPFQDSVLNPEMLKASLRRSPRRGRPGG